MVLLSDKIPNFAPRNYDPLMSGATQMPIGRKQSYESCTTPNSARLFSSPFSVIFLFAYSVLFFCLYLASFLYRTLPLSVQR